MSTPPKPRLTVDEYLANEETAEVKSEFYQGEIFAMSRGTVEHGIIANNTGAHLRELLRGKGCVVCNSDVKVHTPRTGLFTYPDVIVVCGEIRCLGQKRSTLLNPTIIVEVLSPGTEAYDRGRKFEHYQSIESLREYVLIASDRISVMVHQRHSDCQWLTRTVTTLDGSIELESIACRLMLREVYDNVVFRPEEAAAG